MLRAYVHRDAVTVAADSVNQVIVRALFPQNFLAADTVLIGILLKIQVVKQSNLSPEIRFIPISQFLGEVSHNSFHRFGVLQMKRLLVVLGQQRPCLFPAPNRHRYPSLPIFIG